MPFASRRVLPLKLLILLIASVVVHAQYTIDTLAGTGEATSPEGSVAVFASLSGPRSVDYDSSTNSLVMTDTDNYRLLRVNEDGTLVTIVQILFPELVTTIALDPDPIPIVSCFSNIKCYPDLLWTVRVNSHGVIFFMTVTNDDDPTTELSTGYPDAPTGLFVIQNTALCANYTQSTWIPDCVEYFYFGPYEGVRLLALDEEDNLYGIVDVSSTLLRVSVANWFAGTMMERPLAAVEVLHANLAPGVLSLTASAVRNTVWFTNFTREWVVDVSADIHNIWQLTLSTPQPVLLLSSYVPVPLVELAGTGSMPLQWMANQSAGGDSLVFGVKGGLYTLDLSLVTPAQHAIVTPKQIPDGVELLDLSKCQILLQEFSDLSVAVRFDSGGIMQMLVAVSPDSDILVSHSLYPLGCQIVAGSVDATTDGNGLAVQQTIDLETTIDNSLVTSPDGRRLYFLSTIKQTSTENVLQRISHGYLRTFSGSSDASPIFVNIPLQAEAITYDPVSDTLYMLEWEQDNLLTFDPRSYPLVPVPIPTPPSLTFEGESTLFGVDNLGVLYASILDTPQDPGDTAGAKIVRLTKDAGGVMQPSCVVGCQKSEPLLSGVKAYFVNLTKTQFFCFNGANAMLFAAKSDRVVYQISDRSVVVQVVTLPSSAVHVTCGGNSLYFSDFVRIYRLDLDMPLPQLEVLAGTGRIGYGGDTLMATNPGVSLSNPSNLAIAATGQIFFLDQGNDRVRVLTPVTVVSSSVSSTFVLSVVVGTITPLLLLSWVAAFFGYRRLKRQLKASQNAASSSGSLYYEVKLLTVENTKGDIVVPMITSEEVVLGPLVGKGNYSKVFKASWHGGTVAVKQINNQGHESIVSAEFVNELLLISHLGNHPCIVPFVGGSVQAEHLLFNFLPHGSMEDLLIRQGQFALDLSGAMDTEELVANLCVLLQMFLDAAAGVIHCHAKHVIHRDIAARNFLVDPQHRVTLCDFGLSRFLPPGEKIGVLPLSTLPVAWAAPETLLNQLLSPKTDVYSYGVFLNEIIARDEPYPGISCQEIADLVVTPYQPLRPVIPRHCPMELEELIRACWRHEPHDRPSVQEVYDALGLFHSRTQDALNIYRHSAHTKADKDALRSVYRTSTPESSGPPSATTALISNKGTLQSHGKGTLKATLLRPLHRAPHSDTPEARHYAVCQPSALAEGATAFKRGAGGHDVELTDHYSGSNHNYARMD